MEQKSLEDWTLEKQFKSVPGIVDVASFGGATKEYQIRLDPDKLVAYGLSIAQVEQQLANNNTNAGGSFIVAGAQQINVQAQGLYQNVQQIENTVIKNIGRHGDPRQGYCRSSSRAPRSGSARSPKHTSHSPWTRTVRRTTTTASSSTIPTSSKARAAAKRRRRRPGAEGR